MSWLEGEGLSPREERLRTALNPHPSEASRIARQALEEGRGLRPGLSRRRALAAAGALALVLAMSLFRGRNPETVGRPSADPVTVKSSVAVKLANSGNVVTITASSGQVEALVARGGS